MIKLINTRTWFTNNSTIGVLTIDGNPTGLFVLEPTDRGLMGDMTLPAIAALKVWGKTAIPTDTYSVVMTDVAADFAKRFSSLPEGQKFPLLQTVKGFQGVMIHPGNYPKDTEGCQLCGESRDIDFVGNSNLAFDKLEGLCFNAISAGGVTYTIERNNQAWAEFQKQLKPLA